MKVLVVEDDRALAEGLLYALRREGYQAFWAKSGEEALRRLRTEDMNLVILDVRLPGIDGFCVCREIRTFSHMPVLLLTAKDEEVDKVLGLTIGADDYVTKPFSLRELMGRIRALKRRAYDYTLARDQPLRLGQLELHLTRRRLVMRGQEIKLTPTEFGIIAKLAEQPGVVFTRDALIEAIWGMEGEYLTEQNIAVHIHRIREKIETDPSHPKYIVTVRGFGYKLDEGMK